MTTPNTIPLTYNGFVSAIANLTVIEVSLVSGVMTGDANFQAMIATAISYAENRIERDLDILALETSRTYALTSGNNLLQISANDFVTVRTVEANGVPLLPVAKEFLQATYGTGSTLGSPAYFAMYGGDLSTGGNTYNNIIVGPWPAGAYAVTITGTTRAPSLYYSATTPLAATATTWISTNVPDLLVQAAMIIVSEYQRQFNGAASNDPQMPVTYESMYQTLLGSARTEELRKRFAASAWSSAATSVAATPTR